MALFGQNWEESKWSGHFCPAVPTFFASKIDVKLPPEKKVPWHWRWASLSSWWKSHFSQKNAFFGQKKAFFQKVHFIQKCSVTQNTVFQYVKKIFFWSNPKLIFFTKFNLNIAQISCTFDNYVQHLITFLRSWCTGTHGNNPRVECENSVQHWLLTADPETRPRPPLSLLSLANIVQRSLRGLCSSYAAFYKLLQHFVYFYLLYFNHFLVRQEL